MVARAGGDEIRRLLSSNPGAETDIGESSCVHAVEADLRAAGAKLDHNDGKLR
jgi:hypothetical protein